MIEQLELLYREHLTEFRRVATGIAGDVDLGHDAVQEAFARAVRSRRRFRGEGTLEAWVWQIVVNAAHDARRRARHDASSNVPPGPDPTSAAVPLNDLTDRQREIVFLHYFADLSYDDIAAALGISAGTVGATLTAARRTLRAALEAVRT
jgi:DNA-directed RNA polymerase specialized sigma24 family protein